MNPLVFKLIKILFFVAVSFGAGRLLIEFMGRRPGRKKPKHSDPEIFAASVLAGAIITSICFTLIPRLLK